MPRITVVTAARDAEAFIGDTIASIAGQTFTDWEQVIVDDGSTDATVEIVNAAAERDRRVRLVRLPESIGPYAAANVAILAADSEYIARLDADDIAEPSRLAAQLDVLAAAPGKRACATAWRALTPSGVEPAVQTVPSHRNNLIKWMMWFRSGLIHSTLLAETSWMIGVGGYGPELVGEDYRTWAALVRADLLAVTDEPLIQYRFSPGQITAVAGARDQPARIRITLDHVAACTTDPWTAQDARDLRWIGEPADFSIRRAMELLDRFEHAWRADVSLTDDDRQALASHTAARRLRHLRANLSQRRGEVISSALFRAPTTVRAAIRARQRGTSWP